MPSPFIHLHVHSHYSLLRALPKVPELVKAAKEQGMDALALTDYGATYGLVEFVKQCRKHEIKPILGQCANLAIDKHTDRRPRIDDKSHQIVLLCETDEGYRNLLQLTTIAHLDGYYYRPRLDKDLLREHGRGLIGLVGGTRSDIAKALAMDEFGKAEQLAREYEEIFGKGNFFLELQDHPELAETAARNRDYVRLAEATGIPLVATKDVHYLKPSDAEAHDVLTCVGDGKTLDQENRTRMTDADYSFTDAAHMEAAFADVPEAIANTRRIADRCNVEVELGKWKFPHFAIPAGHTHDTYLREMAYAGLKGLEGEVTPVMAERLDYELKIIKNKGYAEYFLVVADYCQFARDSGIVMTTRGSAAGSLVSYAVSIVPVNPLTYNLPFERFLNPFRPSAPDVDCDFEDTRRDEVIAYVTRKYGKDKVAQIGTFGTMAARGSVRDVGRVLDLPYAFVDRVSKLIPMGSQGFAMTIKRALEETPELKELRDNDPTVRRLLGLAQRVEGNARHVSVHAAGVVIAPTPLTDYVALQRESSGEKLITQYEMNDVGEDGVGILKMDFLGIRNLSILGGAVKIIKRTKGVDIDLYKIPLDDKTTYEMLTHGETVGLFQLNGSGMTKYLMELRPTCVQDIMAMVALYRPGPIDSIPEFIRRKNNPSLVTYLDPRLEAIIGTSYGILTYQDDLLMTAINLAGYSWKDADKFRKAVGKKIPGEMQLQKEKFIKGCLEGGMTKDKVMALWALIEPFAAYGFNKAHACSYGIIAYQTAYLKANFPCEYMTSVLTCESGDMDTVTAVVSECGKMGISVLPPDVNSSDVNFTYLDDHNLRFGLLAIKNFGENVAKAIIEERAARGPFKTVAELAERVGAKDFNKKSLEALIKSGAMDGLGERNQLLGNIDAILAHHKAAVRDGASGQVGLFATAPSAVRAELPMRPVPPATKQERLGWEKELLGMYISEHPFHEHAEYFDGLLTSIGRLGETKIAPPEDYVPGPDGRNRASRGTSVFVGGTLMDVKTIVTKKGDNMAFLKLEDETGSCEIVVFPRAFQENKDRLVADRAVFVEGKLEDRDGERKVMAERITLLDDESAPRLRDLLAQAKRKAPNADKSRLTSERAEVRVLVPAKLAPSLAEELKRTFAVFPGPRRVVLVTRDGDVERLIRTSFSISLVSDAINAIERLLGRGAVLGE
jgi:DNA polymerase-3 subunit alpha